MARLYTEQIFWHDGRELRARPGTIRLSREHKITHAQCFTPELAVRGGLNPNDVAIFFGVEPSKDDLKRSRFDSLCLQFGYLVSSIGEKASQGILVNGNECDADPEAYVTPHMEATWELLGVADFTPDEFSMFGLSRYLEAQRLRKVS